MKKYFAIIFLSLYLHAAFTPYMPVVNYVFNYDFYKNVLCENKAKPTLKCNGKCHLAKQIKEAKDKKSDTKLPVPKFDETKIPVSIIETYLDFKSYTIPKSNKLKSIYLENNFNSIYLYIDTPPPNKIS